MQFQTAPKHEVNSLYHDLKSTLNKEINSL